MMNSSNLVFVRFTFHEDYSADFLERACQTTSEVAFTTKEDAIETINMLSSYLVGCSAFVAKAEDTNIKRPSQYSVIKRAKKGSDVWNSRYASIENAWNYNALSPDGRKPGEDRPGASTV